MTIKDPLLGKYEIEWDDTYTLRVPTTVTIDKKTGKELQQYKVYGYFSTLEGALMKCCKLLVEKSSDVATIKEVVERYEQIWLDIKNTIKI